LVFAFVIAFFLSFRSEAGTCFFLIRRLAHIWIEATKLGAPHLDFEMWAFAQSANRFP
jgi:hypothetical protein